MAKRPPLPRDWPRVLPKDAPLTTIERWEQALAQATPADWPDGVDRSALVLGLLRLLAKGPAAAAEVGEKLLAKLPHALWRRALKEGPPQALPVTLTELRMEMALSPPLISSGHQLFRWHRRHDPMSDTFSPKAHTSFLA